MSFRSAPKPNQQMKAMGADPGIRILIDPRAVPQVRLTDGVSHELYALPAHDVRGGSVAGIVVPSSRMVADAVVEAVARGYGADFAGETREVRLDDARVLRVVQIPLDLTRLGLNQATKTVFKHGSVLVQFLEPGSQSKYRGSEVNAVASTYRQRIQQVAAPVATKVLVLTPAARAATRTYDLEHPDEDPTFAQRYTADGRGSSNARTRAVASRLAAALRTAEQAIVEYNRTQSTWLVPPHRLREISLRTDRFRGNTIGGRSVPGEIMLAAERPDGTLFSHPILCFRLLHETAHENYDGHFADFFDCLTTLFNIATDQNPQVMGSLELPRMLQGLRRRYETHQMRGDDRDLMSQYDVRKLLTTYHV